MNDFRSNGLCLNRSPGWGCAHPSDRLWAEATQLEQDPLIQIQIQIRPREAGRNLRRAPLSREGEQT